MWYNIIMDTEANNSQSSEPRQVTENPVNNEPSIYNASRVQNQNRDLMSNYRFSPEDETKDIINTIVVEKDRPLATQVYNLLSCQNKDEFLKQYNKLLEGKNSEEATKNIFLGIQRLTYAIFHDVLRTPPDKNFEETSATTLSVQGLFPVNSMTLHNDLMSKIRGLPAKLNSLNENNNATSPYGLEQEKKIVTMPDGHSVTTTTPKMSYREMSWSTFFKQLMEVADNEKKLIWASYNLSHFLRKESDNPLEVLRAMSGVNTSLLQALPGGQDIEIGKAMLSKAWHLVFQQNGWELGDHLSPQQGDENEPEKKVREALNLDKEGNLHRMRGFVIGRMITYGEELLPYVLASKAKPRWTNAENPGNLGQGPINPFFNPWHLIERYFGGDQFIHGVPFLPAEAGVDSPAAIVEKSIELYKKSRKWGLLGIRSDSDFKHSLPWIVDSNPFGQGGLEATGGERLKAQYTGLLKSMHDKGQGILNDNDDTLRLAYGANVFRDGLKLVENVGVNIVKNFFEEYILKKEMFKTDEAGEFIHIEKFEKLFKYLFKKYFKNNEVNGSNGFYAEFETPEDYWEDIVSNIFNTTGEALEVNWSSRAGELRKHLFNAMSIMHISRNPSDIFIEDPSTSQNGVILLNELTRTLGNSWGNSDADKVAALDKAIANLQIAECLLREAITEKMIKGQTSPQDFYGSDLDQDGHKFLLDKDKIEELLKKTEATEYDIDKAVKVYQFIKDNLWKKPTADSSIHAEMITAYGGEEEYRHKEEEFLIPRMAYFSNIWENGLMGFQPTIGSTAKYFLDQTILGGEVYQNLGSDIEGVTGTFRNFIMGIGEGKNIYQIINDYSRSGSEADFKNILDAFSDLYRTMKNVSEEAANKGLYIALNIVFQALKSPTDNSLIPAPGFLNYIIPPDKVSLAGKSKVGIGAVENCFGPDEFKKVIDYLLGRNTLKLNKTTSVLVDKTPEEIRRDASKGDNATKKWKTETKSIDANNILERYGATLGKIVERTWGPVGFYVLLIILYALIKGGYDESSK